MRQATRLFIVAASLLFVAATELHLRAQESSTAPRPGSRNNMREFLGLGPAPDPVAAERGRPLYASSCAFCHGEKGRGASGPSLIRSPLVLHDEKGESLGAVMLNGRPDKGMPAFPSLTEKQRYDIAQFIHLQVELAANRGTYRRLDVVTGDAKKGEAYFNGAGRCNSCHSTDGDLAHIGGKYPADQLQTRFLWPAPFGERARKAKVTLKSGESFSGTIEHLDDFEISIRDSSGNYHSWSRETDAVKVEVEDRLIAHRRLLDQYTDEDVHNLLAYLVTLK
jgi:cytochrome c oxidase cbb3-type subunit III